MGYRGNNGDVVVTDMIDAGDKAFHCRYRFIPDQDYQLGEIARTYLESDGLVTYLGDWHTHPNGSTELSLLDRRTLTKIATTDESKNKEPIMVVFGGSIGEFDVNPVQLVSGQLRFWPFSTCNFIPLSLEIYVPDN